MTRNGGVPGSKIAPCSRAPWQGTNRRRCFPSPDQVRGANCPLLPCLRFTTGLDPGALAAMDARIRSLLRTIPTLRDCRGYQGGVRCPGVAFRRPGRSSGSEPRSLRFLPGVTATLLCRNPSLAFWAIFGSGSRVSDWQPAPGRGQQGMGHSRSASKVLRFHRDRQGVDVLGSDRTGCSGLPQAAQAHAGPAAADHGQAWVPRYDPALVIGFGLARTSPLPTGQGCFRCCSCRSCPAWPSTGPKWSPYPLQSAAVSTCTLQAHPEDQRCPISSLFFLSKYSLQRLAF